MDLTLHALLAIILWVDPLALLRFDGLQARE
jgi:hypothetical protein